LALSGLDFGVAPLTVRATTMYLIPFQDGAPVALSLLSAFLIGGSGVGPDPLGRPTISNAVVLPPVASPGQVFNDGMFNFTLDPQLMLNNAMTWNGINFALGHGTGSTVQVDELRVGVILDHDYQSFFPPTPLPGDANGDGYVDGADYTLWADNYLLTGKSFAQGNFNSDAIVDGADYTIWADNYAPATMMAALGVVPEPPSALLAFIGVVVCSGVRFSRFASRRVSVFWRS
jgi:hypothetical protein